MKMASTLLELWLRLWIIDAIPKSIVDQSGLSRSLYCETPEACASAALGDLVQA